MYEISQSQVSRAVDVLKNGPMPAETFAGKMWPGRHAKFGRAKIAGNTVLHRLGKLGYVEKAGNLWFLRGFSNSGSSGLGTELGAGLGGEIRTQLPVELPARLITALPAQPIAGSSSVSLEDQTERLRLQQLVGLADAAVVGVTHDAVYGNVRVRGHFIDDCLAEACAFAVLRGRSLNVYPPLGNALVGLSPIEGGRVLHVRWRQSGAVPALPSRGWILLDDGIASAPDNWRPAGANLQWPEEPFLERIARQRAEAGLGPAVNGGSR